MVEAATPCRASVHEWFGRAPQLAHIRTPVAFIAAATDAPSTHRPPGECVKRSRTFWAWPALDLRTLARAVRHYRQVGCQVEN